MDRQEIEDELWAGEVAFYGDLSVEGKTILGEWTGRG